MEKHLTIRAVADELIRQGEGPTDLAVTTRVRRAMRDGSIAGAYKDPGITGTWHASPESVEAWLAGRSAKS